MSTPEELTAAPLALVELTPRGPGGVSVLALRGVGAADALARLTGGALPAPGRPRLVELRAGGEWLDEALVLRRGAEFELHVHGSPALVRRLAAEFAPVPQATPASAAPAASTCLEERAQLLLARAPSEAGARILLDQAEGALRRRLVELESSAPAARAAGLAELVRAGRVARYALEPARLLLAGPVNAGKSTLFNALVGEERVVVSSAPGTTRDLVEAPARLGAWPVRLVDTAGERAGTAALEAAGQKLAREERARADLVLWLAPGGRDTDSAPEGALVLASRVDELPGRALSRADGPAGELADAPPVGTLGALAAEVDPAGARAVVERVVRSALDLPEEAWRPGAPVPFDAALRRAARALAEEPDPARVQTGLRALLGD